MLYLDASALVKRYVEEDGSGLVDEAMAEADSWAMCRIGVVETLRVVAGAGDAQLDAAASSELRAMQLIEVDALLADRAVELAVGERLRTLDALHLAAALVLPADGLTFATWDRRLHAAACRHGLATLPTALD